MTIVAMRVTAVWPRRRPLMRALAKVLIPTKPRKTPSRTESAPAVMIPAAAQKMLEARGGPLSPSAWRMTFTLAPKEIPEVALRTKTSLGPPSMVMLEPATAVTATVHEYTPGTKVSPPMAPLPMLVCAAETVRPVASV